MKILLYGINFSPELTGIGKYTGEMAAWLAARGHQVRVVTAPPYYPAWKVGDGFSNGWTQNVEVIAAAGVHPQNSLQIYRCPLWVPARPGGLKRLLHLASFALSSLPVLLRQVLWRPDVVWAVEPALFCAPAAVAVARLSGAKAWLHVQDFEVDAAFALGMLRGAFLRRVVTGLECWLMRRFDVVSTISQRMQELLLAKRIAPERVVLAPNWVDVGAITANSAITPGVVGGFRAELGIAAEAVVALYAGNMGAKQGLELLAEVARLSGAATVRVPIVFVFCGNGVGRADLVQRCAGMTNVYFLDLQPVERLNELLAMADVHLLPQRADAADLVMPSKLTGMLASGRPVVATALPRTELANVIAGGPEDSDLRSDPLAKAKLRPLGLLVDPGNALAFSDALQNLAENPSLRRQLGSAGRTYAEKNLDRDAVLGQFVARLNGLMDLGRGRYRPRPIDGETEGVMSLQVAQTVMTLLLLALLLGTQMPGAWRSDIELSLQAPSGVSSLAHFIVFATMALLQRMRPMNWSTTRVSVTALALALLSEGLQFFAVERFPRWVDVGIDLTGTLAGLSLALAIPKIRRQI